MIYLVIAISLSLYSPSVSAAQQACCQKTKAGDFCRYTDVDDCDPSQQISPNVYCDNIDFCKVGCCYDTQDGSCSQGVAKSTCQSKPDSVFNPDPQCNIDQCKLACCQISNQCSLATQTKCRATVSQFPGVEMIFHSGITDEQTCIDQCRATDEGACVSQDGSCLRTTRSGCTDTFQQNKLCSHPELKTNCAPQQTTECVGEDVYWFDSCGNKENIYNSNKRASYNSGFIQDEKQTPRAQPNDKNLGNCNYLTGTLCGEGKAEYGNYICRDMNCYDVYENSASPNSGGNKKHGESWCVYDTLPGPGKDVVGSRHKRYTCINGEEIIEECTDFREEYCIQNKVGKQDLDTDVLTVLTLFSEELQGYTEALCKENRFEDCTGCMAASTSEEIQECCNDQNKDCTWENYGNTGSIKNGLCVPLVPPGIKFWETGEQVCAQASQTCKVKYERSRLEGLLNKDWDCVENCHCRDHAWIVAANNYCKTLGDCGAYYNVEGKATFGGFSLGSDATKHSLSISDLGDFKSLLNPSNDAFRDYAWGGKWQERFAYTALATTLALAIKTTWFASSSATAAITASRMAKVAKLLGEKKALSIPGWVGPLIFWISVTVIVLSLLKKDKTETYTFTCEPWEAPDGGNDCEECNDKETECTEYLCKSLGKQCELINKGTEDQKCIATAKTDTTSPIITPGEMSYQITQQENGFEITQLVKPFTPVELILNTDEAAQCKYSLEPLQDYDNMNNFGSSLYIFEHKLLIPIPSEAATEEALLATNGGIYNLYLKCKDYSKNINPRDYQIKFQIDPGPDQTPPTIEKTLPDNNSPIPYGESEYEITTLLNEPADCKWSLIDKDFAQMENNFQCAQTGLDMSTFYPGLYECETKLTDIKQNQLNTFYFRCQDKENNIRQESYVYKLISTPPLQILQTKPEGKIYTRYPVLEVTTAQGSDNGIATCGFNENDVTLTNMLQFFNTESSEHSQQLQPSESKKYNYYIKCVDKAGNIAKDKIEFNLEISLETSQIHNIYKDKNLNILHISTTEPTTCEYSDQPFTYGTGTLMTQPDSKEHTADLGLNVYNIICQDKFNNQNSVTIYP